MAKRKEHYVVEVISQKPYITQILFKTFKRKEAYDFLEANTVERPHYPEEGRNARDNLVFIIYADAYNYPGRKD